MTHNSCCAAFLNSERREVGGIVGGETLNDTNTIEKYQGNQISFKMYRGFTFIFLREVKT